MTLQNSQTQFQRSQPSKNTFFLCFQAADRSADYWSEDFDVNKNCEQEKKVIKLTNEVGDQNKYRNMLFSGNQKLFDHFAGR